MGSELIGQVGIVTGASRGIGRAISMELASAGADVVLAARSKADLDTTVARLNTIEHKALAVELDLTEPDASTRVVESALDEFGRIDILVNCAASFNVGGLDQVSDQDWRDHLELKLLGYVRTMRSVLPSMRSQRYGRIVNVAGNAVRGPAASAVLAGPINAAVTNLTASLAKSEAGWGITVNAVHPGATRTSRHTAKVEHYAQQHGVTTDEAADSVVADVPIGRAIEPEEIAAAVRFFVSPGASAITGQSLAVDGGATLGVNY